MVAAWIRQHVERPPLVGPDAEIEQWVGAVSEAAGAAHIVLEDDVISTIPHVSNAFSVAESIGEGVRAVKSEAGVPTSEGSDSPTLISPVSLA